MLDENLRVLGRRINDLEIDVEDKKEKILTLLREKEELERLLQKLNSQQDGMKEEIQEEMNIKF